MTSWWPISSNDPDRHGFLHNESKDDYCADDGEQCFSYPLYIGCIGGQYQTAYVGGQPISGRPSDFAKSAHDVGSAMPIVTCHNHLDATSYKIDEQTRHATRVQQPKAIVDDSEGIDGTHRIQQKERTFPDANTTHAPDENLRIEVPLEPGDVCTTGMSTSGMGVDFDREVQRLRYRLRKNWRRRLLDELLDPASQRVLYWNLVVFMALVFTAVVTPVEAAFSEGIAVKRVTSHEFNSAGDKLLFISNRIIDLVFLVDMLKNIFLVVQHPIVIKKSSTVSAVAHDRLKHAQALAQTWFPIDLLSVIPFDLIFMGSHSSCILRICVLRLLRFLRLLKLGQSGRILRHWQALHSISFAKLALFKYVSLLFISAHWMSCIWALVAKLQGQHEYTWVDALADSKNAIADRPVFRKHSVPHRYCRGLYFTVYILTGLGLGDVTPSTQIECAVTIAFIIYGGMSWAYIIGNFCSIVTTLDVHGITFRQRMDDLNFYMHDNNFPKELREKCRMYFHKSKHQQRVSAYAQLEKIMSFGLRGEVAAASNGSWLDKVWYLRNASHAFIAELSQELRAFTFTPSETLDLGSPTLFIMRAGIAALSGKILSKGAVWGADFIIEDEESIESRPAIALTYVDSITLGRDNLEAVLLDFPAESLVIRKAIVWYLARALLQQQGRRIIAARNCDCRRKKGALDMLRVDRRLGSRHYCAKRPTTASPRASRRLRYSFTRAAARRSGKYDPTPGQVETPKALHLGKRFGQRTSFAAYRTTYSDDPGPH